MVSIGVFLLIAIVLVGLLQAGLGFWDSGTSRKDVYERAQVLFTTISRDVQAVYAPDAVVPTDPVYPFVGDPDATGAPRLRFVRVEVVAPGTAEVLPASGTTGGVTVAGSWRPVLREIAYGLDPDAAKPVLYRVEAPFQGGGGIFDDAAFNAKTFFPSSGVPLDTGVLYLELRYWARSTGRWDGPRPKQNQWGDGDGPEVRWDSTRQVDREFAYHRLQPADELPDPVYPEMVRITVTLRPQVGELMESQLVTAADDQTNSLRVATTRGFPEPPGFVKVDREWMEYRAKQGATLTVKRGARGTKAAAHAAGAKALAGTTFSTVVPVPVYREGRN